MAGEKDDSVCMARFLVFILSSMGPLGWAGLGWDARVWDACVGMTALSLENCIQSWGWGFYRDARARRDWLDGGGDGQCRDGRRRDGVGQGMDGASDNNLGGLWRRVGSFRDVFHHDYQLTYIEVLN